MKRPLSDFAKCELARIAKMPVPRREVNPGVVRKLLEEGLVDSVMLRSPYKTHMGADTEHLRIARKVAP